MDFDHTVSSLCALIRERTSSKPPPPISSSRSAGQQQLNNTAKNSSLLNGLEQILRLLLKGVDLRPRHVDGGVILFAESEQCTHWYLPLSGEVELYLDADRDQQQNDNNVYHQPKDEWERREIHLATIVPGTMFGELCVPDHTCSARVVKPVDFICIEQNDFMAIYNNYADRMQSITVVCEDLLADRPDFAKSSVRALQHKNRLQYAPSSSSSAQKRFLPATEGCQQQPTTSSAKELLPAAAGAGGSSFHHQNQHNLHPLIHKNNNHGGYRKDPLPPPPSQKPQGHHISSDGGNRRRHKSQQQQQHERRHKQHSINRDDGHDASFEEGGDSQRHSSRTSRRRHHHHRHRHHYSSASGGEEPPPPSQSFDDIDDDSRKTSAQQQQTCNREPQPFDLSAIGRNLPHHNFTATEAKNSFSQNRTSSSNLTRIAHPAAGGPWTTFDDSLLLQNQNPSTSTAVCFPIPFPPTTTQRLINQRQTNSGSRQSTNETSAAENASLQGLMLNHIVPFGERIFHAAEILCRTMTLGSAWMLTPKQINKKQHKEEDFYAAAGAMRGSELCTWLDGLCREESLAAEEFREPLPALVLAAVWQTLMDWQFIATVGGDEQLRFRDSPLAYYRWMAPLFDNELNRPCATDNIEEEASSNNPSSSRLAEERRTLPSVEELKGVIHFLATTATDTLVEIILQKRPHERSPSEVALVESELCHVSALNQLSSAVRRSLAHVIRWDHYELAGSVIFRKGDPASVWYVIMRGSVEVVQAAGDGGKGPVCTLCEGDDFGKLALLGSNDPTRHQNQLQQVNRRQATVTTCEDNCAFLHIERDDFDRILHVVEANTVRLRDDSSGRRGSPPYSLVLQRANPRNNLIFLPFGERMDDERRGPPVNNDVQFSLQQQNNNNPAAAGNGMLYLYSVVAGTPLKVLEYLLETRLDALPQPNPDLVDGTVCCPDVLLEDFILTHPLYLPTNELCNALNCYYRDGTLSKAVGGQCHRQMPQILGEYTDAMLGTTTSPTLTLQEQRWTLRRRVVRFLAYWQHILGVSRFHLDTVARSFIEELYCTVLEDVKVMRGAVGSGGDKSTLPTTNSLLGGLDTAVLAECARLRELRDSGMHQLSRRPRLVLDQCGTLTEQLPAPDPVLPSDLCRLRVYMPDGTFVTVQSPLDRTVLELARMVRQPLLNGGGSGGGGIAHPAKVVSVGPPAANFEHQQRQQQIAESQPMMIELRPNGQRTVLPDSETCATVVNNTGGSDRIFVAVYARELDLLRRLPAKLFPSDHRPGLNGLPPPSSSSYLFVLRQQLGLQQCSILEMFDGQRIAKRLARLHFRLLAATSESELLVQTSGLQSRLPPALAPLNLTLLQRRFNTVQQWAIAEVLLAEGLIRRVQCAKRLIKLAASAKTCRDLLTLFAVTLGLSAPPISRLHRQLWSKMPARWRRLLGEFEALLDPTRNHRAYRLYADRLKSPYIPFLPLALKDLTFICEGNKTLISKSVIEGSPASGGPHQTPLLVNFEKMHIIGDHVRSFRYAKSAISHAQLLSREGGAGDAALDAMIRSLPVIADQKEQMQLSREIEPPTQRNNHSTSATTESLHHL